MKCIMPHMEGLRDSSLAWMLGRRVRHRASPVRHLAGLRRPSAAPWSLGAATDILLSDLDGFGGRSQSDLGFCPVDDGPSRGVCAGCRRRGVPGSLSRHKPVPLTAPRSQHATSPAVTHYDS
jgi:hypothetical protein